MNEALLRKIISEYEKGSSLERLAWLNGLSRARVRELLDGHVKIRGVGMKAGDTLNSDLAAKIIKAVRSDHLSYGKVAEKFKVTRNVVAGLVYRSKKAAS